MIKNFRDFLVEQDDSERRCLTEGSSSLEISDNLENKINDLERQLKRNFSVKLIKKQWNTKDLNQIIYTYSIIYERAIPLTLTVLVDKKREELTLSHVDSEKGEHMQSGIRPLRDIAVELARIQSEVE